MNKLDPGRGEMVRRLFDLIRRVNSSADTDELLKQIVSGVVNELGFGLAAIARVEGDTLVVSSYAGPDDLRSKLMGRRTPTTAIVNQFGLADEWGVLRYVPHHRVDQDFVENAWIPDFVASDAPDAWHPEDALYAPLYSATGELIGNMAVDFPPGMRVPDQSLRELLELFVVQAGLALSNAQQREKLVEQARLNAVLRSVAANATMEDIDVTLATAAREIGGGFGAVQTWINCFARGESEARGSDVGHPRTTASAIQMPDFVRNRPSPLPAEDRTVMLSVDGTADEWLQDVAEEARYLMRDYQASSLSVVPLRVGNEDLGQLVMFWDSQPPYVRDRLRLTLGEMGRELARMVLNHRLYHEERRVTSELQEIDRYRSELVATISHELKTPLTSIVGHVELLMEREPESSSLEAIERNAQRLINLVNHLLDYSRVQDRNVQTRQLVDVVEVVRLSVDLHQFQAYASGVSVAVTVNERALVRGDPDEIARIVDNLISNAIKYSDGAGSRVSVIVGLVDGWVEVSVADTGIGISQEDLASLFGAFRRSSNPVALSIPGSGLGLNIARRFAVLHGGDIVVNSELGVGSEFRLRLPAHMGK